MIEESVHLDDSTARAYVKLHSEDNVILKLDGGDEEIVWGFTRTDFFAFLRTLKSFATKLDGEQDETLAVWFTPGAIRDGFDSYDDDDPAKVFIDSADDDTLREIGEECIGSDNLWRQFHELIETSVEARA